MDLLDPLTSSLRRSTAVLGVELVAVVGEGRHGLALSVWAGEPASVMCTPLAVLRPVLAAGAESVLLLHTHRQPSPPSESDHAVTRRLRAACTLLGLAFVGHVVVDPLGLALCDGSQYRRSA